MASSEVGSLPAFTFRSPFRLSPSFLLLPKVVDIFSRIRLNIPGLSDRSSSSFLLYGVLLLIMLHSRRFLGDERPLKALELCPLILPFVESSDLRLIPVPAEIETTDGRKHGMPLQPKLNDVSNCPIIHADRFMTIVLLTSNEMRRGWGRLLDTSLDRVDVRGIGMRLRDLFRDTYHNPGHNDHLKDKVRRSKSFL